MSQMPGYKAVQVKEKDHRKLKLMSVIQGIKMSEIIARSLSMYEAATVTELPHPPDGTSVPVVYVEKQSE